MPRDDMSNRRGKRNVRNVRNVRNERGDADSEAERRHREIRDDARRFLLEGAQAGVDPWTLLDELASFYDGDIIDLIP